MPVTLKKQRDGKTLRPTFYGFFKQDGKAVVFNTGVPWQGSPPPSLRLKGDAAFEVSRAKAEAVASAQETEAKQKGNAAHLVERLIESKMGRAAKYHKLADLPKLWREIDREGYAPTERYLKWCDSVFLRFAEATPCELLYQVSEAQAKKFAADMRATRAAKTAAEMVMVMRSAFAAFLPVGVVNPFGVRKKGRKGVAKHAGGETVGRKPLTGEQLQTLLDSAKRTDTLLYRLAVVAVFTSLRIGDVCRLQWASVDLRGEGWIKVLTSKTGTEIEVPFLDVRLREVFEAALAEREEGQDLVFPEAAKMYEGKTKAGNETCGMIYYRGKALFARAFADAPGSPVDVAEDGGPAGSKVELPDVLERVLKAVEKAGFAEGKRARILDTVKRTAAGQSYGEIEKATGRTHPTTSEDLREAEAVSGLVFRRGATPKTGRDLKTLIRATRKARKVGAASASVYGWHNLRGTFCCLAFAAGFDFEFVAKATGHKLAKTMFDHYFNPGRDHWRRAMKRAGALIEKTGKRTAPKRLPAPALPAITGGGAVVKATPNQELAALAAKLVDGTATKDDRARLRKLAAKV